MMNNKKLPLLIFDLDGTLIDSADDLHFSMNQMLSHYNRSSVDKPTLVSHIGDGLHKLVNDFFPEYKINSIENTNKVNEFLEIYKTRLTQCTTLYPGVITFLESYQGPIAVVTNKDIQPTELIFKHFQLDQLPWISVIGGDSLPEKEAGYQTCETWMIGDGRPDMKAASAAGCKKMAVHYGYSKPEDLAPFAPDHVLEKFSDLSLVLKL
jgi:phosphoglycolate phosphatase